MDRGEIIKICEQRQKQFYNLTDGYTKTVHKFQNENS